MNRLFPVIESSLYFIIYGFYIIYIMNHPCISRINPTWPWYIICLVCCWIQFAQFIYYFYISIHKKNKIIAFFSGALLSWFLYQGLCKGTLFSFSSAFPHATVFIMTLIDKYFSIVWLDHDLTFSYPCMVRIFSCCYNSL